MIKMAWRKRPDLLVRKLVQAEKKLLASVKDSSGTLARTIQRDMGKRVRVAKTVSRQDNPAGVRQSLIAGQPYRVTLATSEKAATIKVDVRGHWVAARTRGVLGMLRYLGLTVEATWRKGLWLSATKKKGVRARNDSGPVRFFAFSSNPRLRKWASDPAKGLQKRRHALTMTAKMLEALLMGPTFRKNAKKIKTAWRKLMKDWAQS